MIVADRAANLVAAIYKNDSAVGRFIPGTQGACKIMIPSRTIEKKSTVAGESAPQCCE
jgi:hypothetical protein